MKPKTHNRFLTRKQAIRKGKREGAVGYCMLHNKYIHQHHYDKKFCSVCKSYIELKELEEKK